MEKLAQLEDGKTVAGKLGPKLEEVIRHRKIDLVILDPFVKTHAVEKNDNGQIDIVAGILAQLAASCDCAIDAPHHVAKGAGDPGNADRGRGASAFKDATRLVCTLTTMTPEEARFSEIGEAERRRLIRMDSAKVNPRPARRAAIWFRLVGVNLGNGTDAYPHGDEVQTVEPWTPPNAWAGLSHFKLNEIPSRHRQRPRATGDQRATEPATAQLGEWCSATRQTKPTNRPRRSSTPGSRMACWWKRSTTTRSSGRTSMDCGSSPRRGHREARLEKSPMAHPWRKSQVRHDEGNAYREKHGARALRLALCPIARPGRRAHFSTLPVHYHRAPSRERLTQRPGAGQRRGDLAPQATVLPVATRVGRLS